MLLLQVSYNLRLAISKPTIDIGVFEFPCRDFIFEKKVDFGKRSIFGFRKAEVAPNIA